VAWHGRTPYHPRVKRYGRPPGDGYAQDQAEGV